MINVNRWNKDKWPLISVCVNTSTTKRLFLWNIKKSHMDFCHSTIHRLGVKIQKHKGIFYGILKLRLYILPGTTYRDQWWLFLESHCGCLGECQGNTFQNRTTRKICTSPWHLNLMESALTWRSTALIGLRGTYFWSRYKWFSTIWTHSLPSHDLTYCSSDLSLPCHFALVGSGLLSLFKAVIVHCILFISYWLWSTGYSDIIMCYY